MSNAKLGMYLVGRLVDPVNSNGKGKMPSVGYALIVAVLDNETTENTCGLLKKTNHNYGIDYSINMEYISKYIKSNVNPFNTAKFKIIFVTRELGCKLLDMQVIRNAHGNKAFSGLYLDKSEPSDKLVVLDVNLYRPFLISEMTSELQKMVKLCVLRNSKPSIENLNSTSRIIELNKYNKDNKPFAKDFKEIGLVFNSQMVLVGVRAVRKSDCMEVIIPLDILGKLKKTSSGPDYPKIFVTKINGLDNDTFGKVMESLVCTSKTNMGGGIIRRLVLMPLVITPSLAEVFFPGNNIYNYDALGLYNIRELNIQKNIINSARKIEYDLASDEDGVKTLSDGRKMIYYDVNTLEIVGEMPKHRGVGYYIVVRAKRISDNKNGEKDEFIIKRSVLSSIILRNKLIIDSKYVKGREVIFDEHAVDYKAVDISDGILGLEGKAKVKGLKNLIEYGNKKGIYFDRQWYYRLMCM